MQDCRPKVFFIKFSMDKFFGICNLDLKLKSCVLKYALYSLES